MYIVNTHTHISTRIILFCWSI